MRQGTYMWSNSSVWEMSGLSGGGGGLNTMELLDREIW